MNNFIRKIILCITLVPGMGFLSSNAISNGIIQVYPDIEPIEYKLEKPIVRVSTELKEATGRYRAYNVIDRDYRTAWCEGGVNSSIAEWLTFSFNKKAEARQLVTGIKIRIIPGYVKSNTLFFANSRPRRAEIEISTTEGARRKIVRENIDLLDKPSAQVFKIDLHGTYDFRDLLVSIIFKDVFEGKKHSDMCISELEVLPNAIVPVLLSPKGKGEVVGDNGFRDFDANKPDLAPVKRSVDEIYFVRLLDGDYTDNPVLMFEAVNWMAHSKYFRSAEGEESIKELWLDLYVKYPYDFLRAVELQEEEVRDFILLDALVRPVNDKYDYKILYQSALKAKKDGISDEVISPLINEFSKYTEQ
jgi:hypothetical protein